MADFPFFPGRNCTDNLWLPYPMPVTSVEGKIFLKGKWDLLDGTVDGSRSGNTGDMGSIPSLERCHMSRSN